MNNYFEKATVTKNYMVGKEHFILKVQSDLLKNGKNLPLPGQFYMLSVNDTSRILKRPISLHYFKKDGTIEFFIKILGKGTDRLSGLKTGEEIEVQGPLGRGFALNLVEGNVAIVAGGVGLAPFKLVIEYLEQNEKVKSINFIVGGRNKEIVEIIENFNLSPNKKTTVTIATDDGSYGFHGHGVAALEDYYKDEKPDTILTCGPTVMMNGVADFSKKHKIPFQVSYESRMACGIGACVGCSIKTKLGMKRVCKDGPVFYDYEI